MRLQDLDEAVRRYLAWKSIIDEKETLNLDPHQLRQAETQQAAADRRVTARLPETYQWLLVPAQASPQGAIAWQSTRLSGQDELAVRASRKLRSDETLITSFAATRLRMELDRVPLWRGDHVPIKQLVEDFARYLYLPRLKHPDVLLSAIRDGLALLTWSMDSFAYADSYDEAVSRYRGLRCGQMVAVFADSAPGLVVKPDVALKQYEAETRSLPSAPTGPGMAAGNSPGVQPVDTGTPAPGAPLAPSRPKRFHGTVALDASRVGRDAGRIADEVIAHLVGLVGSSVKVTLEIEADVPSGVPDNVVRTVTENSRTLKFGSHGFEKE